MSRVRHTVYSLVRRANAAPLSVFVLCVAMLGGCPSPDDCVDLDGDGFGPGCAMGPDCDDQNAARSLSCDAPPPDCDGDPTLTGCPCLPGTTPCFDGTTEQSGVGQCQPGVAICVNGFWGLCAGSVAPQTEFCDGQDRDCDGEIDEGVTSPCGGCTPGCIGGVWGEGDTPFVNGADTVVTARGYLSLPFEERTSSQVWIANSGEDTLSRVDGVTLQETGRYRTGESPSRVAVDYNNHVWVLSRAFESVGELQEVSDSIDDCVDQDDSGTIETSVGAATLEDDECVIRRVEVGGMAAVPRALAVDGNLGLDGTSGGDLWVGLHDAERIVRLDGSTLETLETIETPGFQPYAFAFDSRGVLWGISRAGYLLSIDRYAAVREPIIREVPLACFELYGLAIDEEGRVVMTGFGCNSVTVYDPVADHYVTASTPQSVRGAVADGDRAFVAHTGGQVSVLQTSPLQLLQTYDLESGLETIGIGLTATHIWAASSRGHISGNGVASALDRETGAIARELPVGFAPHTQGDLTGAKRRGVFADEGGAQHIFVGCDDGETVWRDLRVAALLGGGAVEVFLRHAADESALEVAEFESLGEAQEGETVFTTSVPNAGLVEVRVQLRRGAADAAPRVRRVGLEWTCPGPM